MNEPTHLIDPASLIENPEDFQTLRDRLGFTIHDVAHMTKLSPRQVEALERGDWAQFPAGPFVMGAIRLYARVLRANASPLLVTVGMRNPSSAPIIVPKVDAQFTKEVRIREGGPAGSQLGWVVAGVAVLLLALLVAFFPADWAKQLLAGFDDKGGKVAPRETPVAATTVETITPSPVVVAPTPVDASHSLPQSGAAAPTPTAAPAPPEPVVVAPATPPESHAPVMVPETPLELAVEIPAWMEIRSGDGKVLFSGTVEPGMPKSLAAEPPLNFVIGNASKVQMRWRGSSYDLSPHIKGEVARFKLE